jgi:hypothetical protein
MQIANYLFGIVFLAAAVASAAAADDDDIPAPPTLCPQDSVEKRIACLDQLIFSLSSRTSHQLRPVVRTEAECSGSNGCDIQCGSGEAIFSAVCVSDDATLAVTTEVNKAVCRSVRGLRGMTAICGVLQR